MRVTNVGSEGTIYCQLPSRGTARLMELLEEQEAILNSQVEKTFEFMNISFDLLLNSDVKQWLRAFKDH